MRNKYIIQDIQNSLYIRLGLGHLVMCETCDADAMLYRKSSVRKFYSFHSSLHRHPGGKKK